MEDKIKSNRQVQLDEEHCLRTLKQVKPQENETKEKKLLKSKKGGAAAVIGPR